MSVHLIQCQKMLLLKRLAAPVIPRRQLVTSISLQMPRKGRLQLVEEAEDEEPDKWADYSRGQRLGSGGELASITAFGSIRLDSQNMPRGAASTADKQRSSSGQAFSEQGMVQQSDNVQSDHFGLPVGEEFEKFTPFNTRKEKNAEKHRKSDGRRFAFDPQTNMSPHLDVKVENQTIPVNFETETKTITSDLNYFDEIVFKECYENFNPVSVNNPQAVKIDPSVILSKEQTMETDLNFFDKTYFSQPIVPELHTELTNMVPEPPVKSQIENDKKELSSKYEYDLAPDEIEKPPKIEKQKVKAPKKKEKARLSTEGTALEYVRKLRKMTDNTPSSSSHPKEMLGKHLQDRMLSAAANLQGAATVKKVDNREGEEEGGETILNFVDVKKYKPPDLLKYTRLEVKDVLLSKIIYDNHDIVAVWKPYGLPMFQGKKSVIKKRENMTHSMECFLPDIAAKVKCERLYEVHRLDATTTGVLLYAKTKEMELKLRKLFAERKIKKNYLAVCNGTPQADSGVIDIPIGDGKIGDRVRKTLRPDYNSNKIVTNKKTSDLVHEDAVTEYTVLSSLDNASFVSTSMHTGRKHQIRLHLGLGLGTPILGDHKFSYPTEIGKPQKIHGDILQKLKLKKSKSRHLPIYLHARRVTVPEILPNGNDLVVVATLPHFFSKTLQKLKLKTKHY